MQGTPDPLLGSTFVNVVCALGLAVGLVVGPLVARRRDTHVRIAAVSGVLAAAIGLGVWAVPRIAAGTFKHYAWSGPGIVLGVAFYAAGAVVLALQVAGPVYGFLRYEFVLPLVAGIGSTTLAVFLFLQIGGEIDSFALYIAFSPAVFGAIGAAVVLEFGVRRLRGSWPVSV